MYSPSIPTILTSCLPTEPGVDAVVPGSAGFDQLLAVTQAAVQASQVATAEVAIRSEDTEALMLLPESAAPSLGPKEGLVVEQMPKLFGSSDFEESEPIEESAGIAAILAQLAAGLDPAAQPQMDGAEDKTTATIANPLRSLSVAAGDGSAPQQESYREDARSPSQGDAPEGHMDIEGLRLEEPLNLANTPSHNVQSANQGNNNSLSILQIAGSVLRESSSTDTPMAPTHARLREPVGTSRWADELGSRLVLMSVRGQQQGSLLLTPEHMGPVEVQISVNRDTANVWFGAQQADTRAALNDAMPRLRELLAASGLSLGQSGVSEQTPRQPFEPLEARRIGAADTQGADSGIDAATPAWRRWTPGILDTYA
jgi:flagellar hook-length control protein FliK